MVTGIERMELLDRIGRELQSRMTFSDIDVYFEQHGISSSHRKSTTNSKWVYVKEVLRYASDEDLVRIADELDVPHSFVLGPADEGIDSSFWLPGHFRLFISHVSEFKAQASALQHQLKVFGVSGFVAHADIAPSREWMVEIENAHFTRWTP